MVMHTRSTWTTETGFSDFRLGAPLENRMRLLGIASLRAPPSRWIYLSGIEVLWRGGRAGLTIVVLVGFQKWAVRCPREPAPYSYPALMRSARQGKRGLKYRVRNWYWRLPERGALSQRTGDAWICRLGACDRSSGPSRMRKAPSSSRGCRRQLESGAGFRFRGQ